MVAVSLSAMGSVGSVKSMRPPAIAPTTVPRSVATSKCCPAAMPLHVDAVADHRHAAATSASPVSRSVCVGHTVLGTTEPDVDVAMPSAALTITEGSVVKLSIPLTVSTRHEPITHQG